MKLNLEIDLEDIFFDTKESGDDLNEAIRHSVVNAIADRYINSDRNNLDKKVEKAKNEIQAEFLEKAEAQITEKITGIMEDFLSEEVRITDKWGNVKIEGITLEGLIKKRLHGCMEGKVDKDGRFTDRSYDQKCTLLDYLTGKKLQTEVTEQMKAFNNNLKSEVEAQVTEHLKDNVTANITNLVLENIKPIGSEN